MRVVGFMAQKQIVIVRYMEEGSISLIRLEYYTGFLCEAKFILLVSINSSFAHCTLRILTRSMNVLTVLKLNTTH